MFHKNKNTSKKKAHILSTPTALAYLAMTPTLKPSSSTSLASQHIIPISAICV